VWRAVQELMGIYDYGRHGDEPVSSSEPLEMIREYLEVGHGEDDVAEFELIADADAFQVDEMVAGTLPYDLALAEAVGNVEWLYYYDEDAGEEVVAATEARVTELFEQLRDAGALFGFDGFEQNACAAPTSFLLVLDPDGGKVYGIDLTPCSES
jgi:hypothetical protein